MQTHGNHPHTIVVADDDLEVRNYFEMALAAQGYAVALAEDGEEALRYLHEGQTPVSLFLLDVMMPRKDGIETLREIRRVREDLPVILVSSGSAWPYVMEAVSGNWASFLEKPVFYDELVHAVGEALNTRTNVSVADLAPPLAPANRPLASRNAKMRQIESMVRQVGMSDVPILLSGETGVGKEVLARQLHANSLRAKKPFLKLNCAALPSELVESELFGYERGAFTGAYKDRPGKFEMAQGGSILLDEIGDMDFRLQAKLLQVLQDNEFQRLGSSETVKVDVRVMAATHCDLRKAIKESRFREDLYYRLNVINIQIPPLRERKDEVLWLAEYFLSKHATPDLPPPAITPALREALLAHDWPGNVRELENTMRRYLVLRHPETLAAELAPSNGSRLTAENRLAPAEAARSSSILERVNHEKRQAEIDAILRALDSTHWNRKQAASVLHLDYKAFLYKMKKLGIESRTRGVGY
ncbi:MAG: sigma-54-dependent Fis family transcriptional regulator [Acidobacteria bacterium]|nr:sigma-54-dependent Fis family transcriptional regulator [Acidobacteriota bacterium]